MNSNDIQVGKYTLESLTTGMYSDPKIVYREYIQNSVDALEVAISENTLEPQSMRIDIIVDADNEKIVIRDNGSGIGQKEAVSTLLDIGNSKKRHTNNRGFRGIGRLGGMSYCDTLVFTTSAENEDVLTKISFDCKRLRDLLVPGANEDMDMTAVIEAVTTISNEMEKKERHYFLVEMLGVNSISDLLDLDVIRRYVSQVAPITYSKKRFIYASELHDYLSRHHYEIEEFPIFIGEAVDDLEPLYKLNRSTFHSDRKKRTTDDITKVNYFEVVIDNELYALGWYGSCNWYGTLSEPEIMGLRVRKGNILIGDNRTLNSIFKEPRFNGWVQGEVFIITDKLIPNARRDDFEQNEAYFKFINYLSEGIGNDISKSIREASSSRNDPFSKTKTNINHKLTSAKQALENGFNSSNDKSQLLSSLQQEEESLKRLTVKHDQEEEKEQLQMALSDAIKSVETSKNYKINQINSGIDKKGKKLLVIISDILSKKLSKPLVDDIIEEIVDALNRK